MSEFFGGLKKIGAGNTQKKKVFGFFFSEETQKVDFGLENSGESSWIWSVSGSWVRHQLTKC